MSDKPRHEQLPGEGPSELLGEGREVSPEGHRSSDARSDLCLIPGAKTSIHKTFDWMVEVTKIRTKDTEKLKDGT